MDCNKTRNSGFCNCTFSCSKKGICCDCIHYHRRMGQLPACYFPKEEEGSGDRSIRNFIRIVEEKGIGYLN